LPAIAVARPAGVRARVAQPREHRLPSVKERTEGGEGEVDGLGCAKVRKGENEHILDQLFLRRQRIAVLARSLYPLAIRRLASLEVGILWIWLVRLEARIAEKDVGLLAVMLGEKELPLGVGGVRLTRGRTVGLEKRDPPQRRSVFLRGKPATALTDQENDGIALLDVGPKLFEKRRGTLAEILLVPHLQFLAPQDPGDLHPVRAQLPRDRREEDAIGGRSAHRADLSRGASFSNGSVWALPVRAGLAMAWTSCKCIAGDPAGKIFRVP
jgi:hypothetical protein